MATLSRRAARTPLAPVVAGMFATAAAILVIAIPSWLFDRTVAQSGLPTILSFAAPPLGMTARVLAAGLAFGVVGSLLWLALSNVEKLVKAHTAPKLWSDDGAATIDEPVKFEGRRRPIFAPAELGAPLMSDEAISDLRKVEPEAEPEAPIEPRRQSEWLPVLEVKTEPEPVLEAPLSVAEFDLPPSDEPDDGDTSIQALIRRLESGLARRAANDPGPDSPNSVAAPLALSKDWIVHDNEQLPAPDSPPVRNGDDENMRQALGTLKKFVSR
ncbi:hypothetical protein [Sphingomonas sp.]|uniref:hypothetical protein n=1 Tax=Sphingomonas sp. TaxID=28214 RepID=UPI0025CC7CF2|nr:hypothetical protein [Sphingomonas sp.]